jgi:hypothetical protein
MVLNLVPQQKDIFGFYLPVVIAIYNIVSDNFAIFTSFPSCVSTGQGVIYHLLNTLLQVPEKN